MVEFFEQNMYLVIGVLAVLVLLLLFVFLRKPKKEPTVGPKKVNENRVAEPTSVAKQVEKSLTPKESETQVDAPKVEKPSDLPKPDKPVDLVKPDQPAISNEEKPRPKQDKPVAVETKKTEPSVEETSDDSEDDPSKDNVTKDKPAKYHVSQNKDDKNPNFKKWRVRKEGSTKTIKYLDTQKEAIEYATDLAEKAGTTIVIHKVDGSIRKQDYTKK